MPLDATPPPPRPAGGALRRVGALSARGWRMKLYAPAAEARGLRPEDLAASGRAFRAGVAAPGAPAAAGFALLRRAGGAGDLAFSAFWWEGRDLHRAALLLPGDGGPPRRAPGAADRIGTADEAQLMGREAAAWRRWVLDAPRPAPDAYLAECCA